MPRNPSHVLMRPCVDCGELAHRTRCAECQKVYRRPIEQERISFEDAGYDAEFRRIAKKAKKLQPFCLHCGHTGSKENPLSCDHLPSAWERKKAGKKLRLKDVRVLCRVCNSKAGPARESVRGY